MKLSVKYYNEYIAIMQGKEEIIGWEICEWEEDPQIVFAICHAIQLVIKNPKKLLRLIKNNSTKKSLKEGLYNAIP